MFCLFLSTTITYIVIKEDMNLRMLTGIYEKQMHIVSLYRTPLYMQALTLKGKYEA